MFIVAPFTMAKTWNQPKCPSRIDWTRKMRHIYTMEYYAAIKNDEFVFFVETWMNLGTIILSKLTQEQKINHHMFFLIGLFTLPSYPHPTWQPRMMMEIRNEHENRIPIW
uniref:DUF1725 domain-containing protein n=1 Tax=Callithrix jacchus TaxID=9483 RepID=A0A8I3ZZ14_CALJA